MDSTEKSLEGFSISEFLERAKKALEIPRKCSNISRSVLDPGILESLSSFLESTQKLLERYWI